MRVVRRREASRAFESDIVRRDLITAANEIGRHWRAHIAHADEADARHAAHVRASTAKPHDHGGPAGPVEGGIRVIYNSRVQLTDGGAA
jgi:hypothetical protein